MFDAVEAYSGGIYFPEARENTDSVPETKSEFPVSQDEVAVSRVATPSGNGSGVTPETIIQNAYREADRIVEEAREHAQREGNAIVDDARNYADNIAANAVTRAVTEFDIDLWSSRHALADVVSDALTEMIGQVGEYEACYRAVEVAIKKQCKGKVVKVSAESRTADRLRLVALSNRVNSACAMFDIVNDDSLEPGRCIINAEGQLLDVSIDAQISAIKESCEQQIAANGAEAPIAEVDQMKQKDLI